MGTLRSQFQPAGHGPTAAEPKKDPHFEQEKDSKNNFPTQTKTESQKNPSVASKRETFFTLTALSVGFTLTLTSYGMIFYPFEESVLIDGKVHTSIVLVIAFEILGSVVISVPVLRKIGAKWSIAASMLTVSAYIGLTFLNSPYPQILSAMLLGVGMATCWMSVNYFVSQLSYENARQNDSGGELPPGAKALKSSMSRFFGFFTFVVQMNNIWGNVAVYQLLQTSSNRQLTSGSNNMISSKPINRAFSPSPSCGAKYCNDQGNFKHSFSSNWTNVDLSIEPRTMSNPDLFSLHVAAAGISLLAVLLIALAVRPLAVSADGPKAAFNPRRDFAATFNLWRNRKQQFLILPTVTMGILLTLFTSDFIQAFVKCAKYESHHSTILITYGVFASSSSLIGGYLTKYVSRPFVMTVVFVINMATMAVMQHWSPSQNPLISLYAIASLWGLAMGIWVSKISAIYGEVFVDAREAAYANMRLWQTTGFAGGLVWSHHVCMETKLTAVMATLLAGVLGYTALEILLWRESKVNDSENNGDDQDRP